MKTILTILLLAGGVLCALGIWLPRFQIRWQGTGEAGAPLSNAGAALFFFTGGVAVLCLNRVSERYRAWFAVPVVLGWILIATGHMLDSRAYLRSKQFSSEAERQCKPVGGLSWGEWSSFTSY